MLQIDWKLYTNTFGLLYKYIYTIQYIKLNLHLRVAVWRDHDEVVTWVGDKIPDLCGRRLLVILGEHIYITNTKII